MKPLMILAASMLPVLAQSMPSQGVHAELSQIQTVYLLKMRGGLDQHLANQLTASAFFRVVTDPAKADAILTDQVGVGFERTMTELYPPPPPPDAPKEEVEEDEEASKGDGVLTFKEAARPVTRGLGGSSGTIFLVNRYNRQVVWSTYLQPKDSTSKQLNGTAKEVIERLQSAVEGKKK